MPTPLWIVSRSETRERVTVSHFIIHIKKLQPGLSMSSSSFYKRIKWEYIYLFDKSKLIESLICTKITFNKQQLGPILILAQGWCLLRACHLVVTLQLTFFGLKGPIATDH